MSRTARPWRGAGFLMLGGALLSGVTAFVPTTRRFPINWRIWAARHSPKGRGPRPRRFSRRRCTSIRPMPPRRGDSSSSSVPTSGSSASRCKMPQDAKPDAPQDRQAGRPKADGDTRDHPAAGYQGHSRAIAAAENIARQQLTNDVEQRIQSARALLKQDQPEAALNALRLTQNVVRSATNVPEDDRTKLDRRIQAQMIATVQAEERIVAERADASRLEAAAEQRTRAIDLFQRNKETIGAMMIQFDTLISEGVYNVLYIGGMGNITTDDRSRSTKPGCWPRRPMPSSAAARCPTATTTPPPAPASPSPTP